MSRDTTPDAAAMQTAIYRRMSGSERVAIALQLAADTRAITLAGIRHRHPEYDGRSVELALFRILLGDDLFCRVYPDAPLIAP